ncbi:MAG: CorA family divalent cation transporter [Gemmatimonadota bacterium]
MRRAAWPVRELVLTLQREESELVSEETAPYLRDAYDHVVQVVDTTETYRDLVSGLVDLYMTGVSNRMNEVMKVLTIIATIFIPVTFVAGVYGMNFEWMPELQWRWGYPAVLALMALMSGGMVLYFRRRDWI